MKFNDKIPKQFLEFQKKIKSSLEAMGVRQKFVYTGIGMSKTTWDRRLKLFNFTADEVIAICDLINGKK